MTTKANGSARAVSRVLDPETARQLRALQQSHDLLSSRIKALEESHAAMAAKLSTDKQPKELSVTGTEAFILRNRT